MAASPQGLSRIVPALALAIVGASLCAVGLWLGSWWTLTGGVLSLTGAAWLVTDPP